MIRAVALLRRSEDLSLVRVGVGLGETTVISVTPPGDPAEALLKGARQAGAVRCVRLWDAALESTDYLGVAYTLAATVRAVMGDLTTGVVVLCGSSGRGAVGPAVAERLGLPHLGGVLRAELSEAPPPSPDGAPKGDERVVARRRSGALVKLFAGKPPLVLCVDTPPAAEELALGDAAEVEVWPIGKAGLTAAELSYRKRFRPHPSAAPESAPRRFADAASLAARLRADGVLAGGN